MVLNLLFKKIKYSILEWRYEWFLRRRGYQTWEKYLNDNDPDFNCKGHTLQSVFCGYPFVTKVNRRHYTLLFDCIASGENIITWCKQNCNKKYRGQLMRVVVDSQGQYVPNRYLQNGIAAGIVELFIGFKDEQDYIMFVLTWGD